MPTPTPFETWLNLFRLPLSGDVAQTIDPRFFSPTVTLDFAGDPQVEGSIVANVASYGSQLDALIGAVLRLGKAAGIDLADLQAMSDRIETEKHAQRAALRGQAERALKTLEKEDAEGYRALVQSLR